MRFAVKRASRPMVLALVVIMLIFGAACAGQGKDAAAGQGAKLTLTLEELAEFDGLEGRRAYIAVDGIVYDVTDMPQWKDGLHQGRFQAGQDYSRAIREQSPHGTGMLSRAVEVGVLAEAGDAKK